MAEAGTLVVTITGDTSGLTTALATAGAKVEAFSGEAAAGTEAAALGLSDMLPAIGAVVAALGVAKVAMEGFNAVKGAVQIAESLQEDKLAFQNMTGSAQEAADIMVKLSDFAKRTPFTMPQVVESAKQLMAFGVAGDQLTNKLTLIGDAAARMNVPMQQAIDVWQEAQAGIFNSRIYAPLGVTRDMLEQFGDSFSKAGTQIDSSKLLPSLEAIWGSSGRAGAMAIQMTTLGGRMTNLSDQVTRAAAAVGGFDSTTGTLVKGGLLDILTTQLGRIGDWIDANQPMIIELSNRIGHDLSIAVQYLTQKFEELWPTIKNDVLPALENMGHALKDGLPMMKDFIGLDFGLLKAELGAISGAINIVADAIRVVTDAYSKFKALLQSPIKVDQSNLATAYSQLGVTAPPPTAGFPNKRASGGPVSSNTPYLVGENGPELFMPSGSGSIRPNGGSSTMNQSVSVNIGSVSLGGSMDVNRFAQELGRQIQAKLMGAVAY